MKTKLQEILDTLNRIIALCERNKVMEANK